MKQVVQFKAQRLNSLLCNVAVEQSSTCLHPVAKTHVASAKCTLYIHGTLFCVIIVVELIMHLS
jgi:hypothetical protein